MCVGLTEVLCVNGFFRVISLDRSSLMMVPMESLFTHTPGLRERQIWEAAYVCKFPHLWHYLEEVLSLTDVMYDCQGDMKATRGKSAPHMHAESRYAVTYDDSSRTGREETGRQMRKRIREKWREEEWGRWEEEGGGGQGEAGKKAWKWAQESEFFIKDGGDLCSWIRHIELFPVRVLV